MFILKAREGVPRSSKETPYGTAQRVQDAIEAAKILYETHDSVEIFNGDKLIYSIEHDPKNPDNPIIEDNTGELVNIPSTLEISNEPEWETPPKPNC